MLKRSFHALGPVRQMIWRGIAWLVPADKRHFFEGSLHVRGQLWCAERQLLFDTIRQRAPMVVMEVGTWEGGGSTLFISEALRANGSGIVHTIEADRSRSEKAVANYALFLPHLLPHVVFHEGISTEVYPPLIQDLGQIDAVFLDGAQDAEQTLAEYRMFEPALGPNSILMMHDWDNEKMWLVRQLIESSDRWQLLATLTSPASVGFAVWIVRADS